MKQPILIGIVVLAAAPIASAAPPTCHRWRSPGTDCDLLGKPSGCVVTGVEHELANTLRFQSSPYIVCKSYVKRIGKGTLFDIKPGASATTKMCHWDNDGDGMIDDSPAVQINEDTLTPEPHCFCTPKPSNPYAGLTWSGNMSEGEKFLATVYHIVPRELKKAVLAENYAANNDQYVSDATNDAYSVLQKSNIYDADAAEIDHIIPRVDSQGCLCGDPTPDNLAVISRELNGMMSNISPNWNQARAKMYAQFVDCEDPATAKYKGGYIGPPFPIPLPLEDIEVDETTLDVDIERDDPRRTERTAAAGEVHTGGCAASDGGGALGLGLALLLVRRRRRAR